MRSLSSSVLLSVAVVSSLLGCAMPLCALATAAAFLVPRRSAFAIAGIGWLLNQVLGFTVHGYPHTRETFAWGIAIGIATFASLAIATRILQHRRDVASGALSLVGAFVAFEAMLVLASVFLGGWGAYTAPVVMQVFGLNVIWFAGTVAAVLCLQRLRLPSRV